MITYTSIVSRETICLALLLTALHDFKVKVGDDFNAYITALITKKYGQSLNLNLAVMPAKVPSLCMDYMD
jgi:hypothetical protein